MARRVFVVGVGMTKFLKPGRPNNPDYPIFVKDAVLAALNDARLVFSDVEQAAVGYVYGETASGQRALYEIGPPRGIPIFNLNNNCSTGATALLMARNLVLSGSNCVLAVGFDKIEKNPNQTRWNDRASPFEKFMEASVNRYGIGASPPLAQMFGNAAREHVEKYGTKREHFAKIAEKNHRHSAENLNSQFREIYTFEDIMKSPTVHDPLTKLQCSPLSDGAAAALVVSEDFVVKRGLEKQAVEILSIEMATDTKETFDGSCISAVGFNVSKLAADRAFRKAGGVQARDVQLIELHDSFSSNELITYEALGLCPVGKGCELVEKCENTYGGKWVVNPSGGLISRGHAPGATGLAQCAELCWQLRGLAGLRQVPGAKIALQHNMGLGGAAIVALFQLGFSKNNEKSPFKSSRVFEDLQKNLANEARFSDVKRRIPGIVCFKVSKQDGTQVAWIVDLKSDAPSVKRVENAEEARGDCILTISDEDLSEMKAGRLNPQKAFRDGRLKVTGNLSHATKIHLLLQSENQGKARL